MRYEFLIGRKKVKVVLISSFDLVLTNQQEKKQFLLQVVEKHRQKYSVSNEKKPLKISNFKIRKCVICLCYSFYNFNRPNVLKFIKNIPIYV